MEASYEAAGGSQTGYMLVVVDYSVDNSSSTLS